jgi:hypothetical protein
MGTLSEASNPPILLPSILVFVITQYYGNQNQKDRVPAPFQVRARVRISSLGGKALAKKMRKAKRAKQITALCKGIGSGYTATTELPSVRTVFA